MRFWRLLTTYLLILEDIWETFTLSNPFVSKHNLMKKFIILLSAGIAFAFASCSHSSDSCCGECAASKCCADGKCEKCTAK